MKKNILLLAFLFIYIFSLPVAAAEEPKISKKAGKVMAKALEAIKQKQHDQAIDLLKQVMVLEPEYALGYHNLGVLHFEKGLLDEAIGYFENALRLKNDYLNALLALRQTLFEAGKTASSQRSYEKSNGYLLKLAGLPLPTAEEKNLLAGAKYLLGFNFFHLRLYPQAIDFFDQCQKVMDLEKDYPDMYANATYFLGMMHHILGRYELSSDYFHKYLDFNAAVEAKPEYAGQANYFLGANLFRQLEEKLAKGDVEKMTDAAQEIIPYLNRAVEMKTSIEDAYVMLGNCYVYIKNYDSAVKTYQQLCELFPQSSQLKNYQIFLLELQKMQQKKKR